MYFSLMCLRNNFLVTLDILPGKRKKVKKYICFICDFYFSVQLDYLTITSILVWLVFKKLLRVEHFLSFNPHQSLRLKGFGIIRFKKIVLNL